MDTTAYAVLTQNWHSEAATKKIQGALDEVWQEIQSDKASRQQVADLLGIDADEVVGLPLPVHAKQPTGGLFSAEITLLIVGWVGNEILLKALANVVRPKVEKLLTDLWSRMLQARVDKKLGHNATGQAAPEDKFDKK